LDKDRIQGTKEGSEIQLRVVDVVVDTQVTLQVGDEMEMDLEDDLPA
jgi:hypothetical protein